MIPKTPLPGNSGQSSENAAAPASLPPSARTRRLTAPLAVMLVVYGLWLCWLFYVAWVNVRAGNQ